jgi:hypothetical protein
MEAQRVLALPFRDGRVATPGAVRDFCDGHCGPDGRHELGELKENNQKSLLNPLYIEIQFKKQGSAQIFRISGRKRKNSCYSNLLVVLQLP